MKTLDLFRSVGAAFADRGRAALTLLGVVIGTSSIVLLASLLHGGEQALVGASQEAADDDVIEVHREATPPAQRERTTRALSRADAAALGRSTALAGAMIQPESSHDVVAREDGRKKRVAVVSGNGTTRALYRLEVERGRFLDEEDERQGRRVCVLGHEVHEELMRSAPVGAMRIDLDGQLFTVVGVLAKKPMLGSTDSTYLWDRKVLIPEATYDALYEPSHEVTRIYVRKPLARPTPELLAPLRSAVSAVILRRHLGVTNFALQKDETGGQGQLILTIVQVLLLGTGVLALLASGINIMNVMLVTVSERTREIGLRRAIGATPRSIVLQFLLEALSLSLVGGMVGLAVGALLSWATALLARSALGAWELAIPPWSLGLGLALAMITGLVFGIAPALRAAKISPIDALRSE
jgi:putative ABC transport system permease protein